MNEYLVTFYNVGTQRTQSITVMASDTTHAERNARDRIHLTAGQWVIIRNALTP